MPSSVANTEIQFVLRAWLRAGTHVTTPLYLLMQVPLGASTISNVTRLGGRSGSETTLVTRRGIKTWAKCSLAAMKIGALLVLRTVTEKLWVALRLGNPSSLTIKQIRLVRAAAA